MLARPAARALRYQASSHTLSATRSRAISSIGSFRRNRQCSLNNRNVLRPVDIPINNALTSCRSFWTESIPAVLVPPVVFVGLLLALWAWKCMMMVVFQDKIIYMPSMPPFARSEKIEDYTARSKPVEWEERRIKSFDGTKIALCIGRIPLEPVDTERNVKDIVICYFQGNGSSTPPRLPILSSVLRSVHARSLTSGIPVRYSVIALSYRGYWRSSGRASQSGIEVDAQAMLDYVNDNFSGHDIVLWGQSIGSSVALTAAATYASREGGSKPMITGLVLETPFSSIRSMLVALYPQKWLPYRYLWPFLWNRWDSEAALRKIAASAKIPKILLLPATRDEIVPAGEADKLEAICKDLGYELERSDVVGALHTEATTRKDGQESIAKFILDVSRNLDPNNTSVRK